MKEDKPVLYMKKEECSGCAACFSICRQKAICMKRDEEGFLYPQIDSTKCVHCGLCVRVCPLKTK